jgi:outer membrane protein assembly factor BamD
MTRRALTAWLIVGSLCAAPFGPGAQAKEKVSKTAALPPEEAYQLALDKIAHKRYYSARSILQELLPRIPPEDRELLPKVQLAIADAFFMDGGVVNYGEALNSYRNFLTYFPQHERADYVQYMVGMSMFKQVLAPDRDQSMTVKAIDELRKVETLHPQSQYAAMARQAIDQGNNRLAEKERIVGRFYQKRRSWPAAVDRYRAVLDRYPRYDKMNQLLLDMSACLLRMNRRDEAQEYIDRLARDDAGKLSRQAQKLLEDYERRREKEGEKFYGELNKQDGKKAPGS